MSDLTLRETKGSPLTHQELDTNIKHSHNPIGSVIAFAGINPPFGYLLCHGQEVSRSEYSNLFNIIGELYGSGDSINTFNLPDLRGEFIRGFDAERGIDSGREMGSFQEGTRLSNRVRHSYSISSSDYEDIENYTENIKSESNQTWSGIRFRVRPRNVALNYIIKY